MLFTKPKSKTKRKSSKRRKSLPLHKHVAHKVQRRFGHLSIHLAACVVVLAALNVVIAKTPLVSAAGLASIGHVEDTIWLGMDDYAPNGHNDMSVDIKPEVFSGTDGYFYALNAHLSNGKGDDNMYAGLQTAGHYNAARPNVGKMLIFSVWNAKSGKAEPGGVAVPFSGEGSGYSVRLAYNWKVGTTYRVRMYIDSYDSAHKQTVWAASVQDLTTHAVQRIGRIPFATSKGKLTFPATFHERYAGSTKSCSAINPSRVTFTNMRADSSAFRPRTWYNYQPVTLSQCPNKNWVQVLSNGVRSGVGIAASAKFPVTPTVVPKSPYAKSKCTPYKVANYEECLLYSVEGELFRMYHVALNRDPDTGGLNAWAARMLKGTTLQSIGDGFINSNEGKKLFAGTNNTQFVTKLYKFAFNRAPDKQGLANWVNQLNRGMSRGSVAASFTRSKEAQQIWMEPTTCSFANICYQGTN